MIINSLFNSSTNRYTTYLSEYWALAYMVWIISFVYFHSIVAFKALNIVYIDHSASLVTLKLNDFLYCFWIITCSWRCSYSSWSIRCLSSCCRCLWEMIYSFIAYLFNIASILLKLLYLVLYLIYKGKLMHSFSSIIFL